MTIGNYLQNQINNGEIMKPYKQVDPLKAKVFALYGDKTKSYLHSVVAIDKEKGYFSFATESPFLSRLSLAWNILISRGFTINSPIIEEKTEKEIINWNNGKGLK